MSENVTALIEENYELSRRLKRASDFLMRISDQLDNLSPDDTIGFTNGSFWIDLATVSEIREAAYPSNTKRPEGERSELDRN